MKVKRIIGDKVPHDNVSKLLGHVYIAEICKKYLGFEDDTNNFAIFPQGKSEYPIYQIVFEDRIQQLVFEYTGDDQKGLEEQLHMIYPAAKISTIFGDYMISIPCSNYDNATDEIERMKAIISKNNKAMANEIRLKPLVKIDGSTKRAFKSRMPHDVKGLADMKKFVINITINDNRRYINKAHNMMVGNNNTMNVTETKSKEHLHKEWIMNNPPEITEGSKAYHERSKLSLSDSCSIKQQAKFLRELNYASKRIEKGVVWQKRS